MEDDAVRVAVARKTGKTLVAFWLEGEALGLLSNRRTSPSSTFPAQQTIFLSHQTTTPHTSLPPCSPLVSPSPSWAPLSSAERSPLLLATYVVVTTSSPSFDCYSQCFAPSSEGMNNSMLTDVIVFPALQGRRPRRRRWHWPAAVPPPQAQPARERARPLRYQGRSRCRR